MGIIEIEPICCEFLTLKWNPRVVNLLKMYVAILSLNYGNVGAGVPSSRE